ncbi:MAG: LacI family transcriptional regulator [Clostridiales bacterium]|nr:LacI family transcriptional regulator [Clostridiales bacterium]
MKKIRQSEVAELAGVSIAAVSRVMNNSGYVSQDVRNRIEQAVQQLGYTPVSHSRPNSKKLIALVLPQGILNPYFEKLESCLHRACMDAGFGTIFVKADKINNSTMCSALRELENTNICGIVIASFSDNVLKDSTREELRRQGVPVVFIERTAGCTGFNRVTVDNHQGTLLATSHLIHKGHKELLYVSKTTHSEAEQARLQGFLDAIKLAGCSVQGYVKHCSEHKPSAAWYATEEAFREHPGITGIVNWTDTMALGAMMYVMSQGKRVPQDIEIVGHDDILAPLLVPAISSVHMPLEEIASAAIDILERAFYNPGTPIRTVAMELTLTIRDGSGE